MVPQPLHWNTPPQSPVWQCPAPGAVEGAAGTAPEAGVQVLGVVIVTLCRAGSSQPVAVSGVFALGAAATQIVCVIWLTNVTRRWPPAGWPTAPEGGGTGAAGAVREPVLCTTDPAGAGVPAAGASLAGETAEGRAIRGLGVPGCASNASRRPRPPPRYRRSRRRPCRRPPRSWLMSPWSTSPWSTSPRAKGGAARRERDRGQRRRQREGPGAPGPPLAVPASPASCVPADAHRCPPCASWLPGKETGGGTGG